MKISIVIALIVFCNLSGVQAKSNLPLAVVGQSSEMVVVNEVSLTGTVYSHRSASLSAAVSGLVEAMLIDEGQRVHKGDVILKLDPELEKLKLNATIAETSKAQHELADAKRRLSDVKRLVKNNSVSKNDVQSMQSEVSVDSAALQRARAILQQQEERLRRHQVLAPFDGVISKKLVEVGEWISPGDVIANLVATDNLRIDFQAPQSVYPLTTLKTPVRVSLDSMPNRSFDGKIIAIVPVTNEEARTFIIRVTLDADELRLIPGMSANGILKLDSGRKAVVVLRDAILRHPDGRTTVWIVNQDKTVSERLVKTGLSFNGYIVIEEGLEMNERIVLQGNESLREGQMISIKQE